MTTIAKQTTRCFVCGTENEFCVVVSTNSFGPTDLDTRPPEMKRSTMNYWVQTCPSCGYSATDVSDDTTVARTFLETESYQTYDGIPFLSELAKEFYRHYLIQAADHRKEDAFFALLHAAWACDDKDDETCAVQMRNKAISIANDLLVSGNLENKDTLRVMRADLLRRATRFDELLDQYAHTDYQDELLNSILRFEKEMARRKNSECLTVQDAEEFAKSHPGKPAE